MRRLAVLGALIVFLAVVIAPTLRSYISQRDQVSQLRAQVASQEAGVRSLEAKKRKWDDPAYVKAQAGQRLGYAEPGKTLTIKVPDRKSGTRSARVASRNQTWYGTMWKSAVAAGER